jgi:AraC-like DNA-binding protein
MSLQECGLNRNSAGKELQPHGTAAFPCAAYEAAYTDKAADMVPWHWHEEIEIIYLKSGDAKLQIPGREYFLCKGELAVVNSGLPHSVWGQPYCELQSLVFSIFLIAGSSTTAFYQKYLQPLLACPEFTVLKNGELEAVNSFQEAFEAIRRETFAYEFTTREQLSKLLLFCFEALKGQLSIQGNGKSADMLRIEQMLQYIQLHYAEAVSLREIAGAADIGERECLRCFKRMIGEAPIQYLLKYRLMQSAGMLLEMPSASIAQIADACGFDYPGYYSRQFRRFYQCTPREYREKGVAK